MVGVCIKYFYANYGGMLQAFATVKLLEEYGIKYELIRYKKKKNLVLMIKFIPRVFNRILMNDKIEETKKKINAKKHPDFQAKTKVRIEEFDKFCKEHFSDKLSELYDGIDDLKNKCNKYEAVITGSDQLWSPAGLPTNFYNLMFVPNNIRKISIASSFGVKYIPWYQKGRTKKYLNRIEYVSMRENSGKEIVKELTGRDVPVILDPVFMFDKEGWERLLPNKNEYNEKYVFAYFLGENRKYREDVEKFAKSKGLKIVTIRHKYIDEEYSFGDYAPYDVGPEKFLNYIRNAEYVFTDSFHGAVLSIIHNKNFVIFNRYDEDSKYSKNSRIDSLCQNLGLEQSRYSGSLDNVKDINYNEVNQKYIVLKEETDKYLKEAFKDI